MRIIGGMNNHQLFTLLRVSQPLSYCLLGFLGWDCTSQDYFFLILHVCACNFAESLGFFVNNFLYIDFAFSPNASLISFFRREPHQLMIYTWQNIGGEYYQANAID